MELRATDRERTRKNLQAGSPGSEAGICGGERAWKHPVRRTDLDFRVAELIRRPLLSGSREIFFGRSANFWDRGRMIWAEKR